MLKTLFAKRAAALGLSIVVSVVMPYVLQDKPKIKWVWDRYGPMVVDAAQELEK